jgi:arginine exporter protein ArgO
MFAARTKRNAVAFVFVASTITASVAWFATLGWGLIALLQILLS